MVFRCIVCKRHLLWDLWECEVSGEIWDYHGCLILIFVLQEMNNTPTRSDDPLFEWVHCDKCGKWRRLHPSVDKNYLPKNWFCTDFPYLGSCKEKEEKEVDGKYMIQIDDPMPR